LSAVVEPGFQGVAKLPIGGGLGAKPKRVDSFGFEARQKMEPGHRLGDASGKPILVLGAR
jgi:hypothetical protein